MYKKVGQVVTFVGSRYATVNLQHFPLSAGKAADPQRWLQTAVNAVDLQHLEQWQFLQVSQRLPMSPQML